jgi:hypothetical protein
MGPAPGIQQTPLWWDPVRSTRPPGTSIRRAFGMNDLITVSVFGAARNRLSVSLC